MAERSGPGTAAAAFAGLAPDRGHVLARSQRSCEQIAEGADPSPVAVASFVTDDKGTAYSETSPVDSGDRSASLLVARESVFGPLLVACAPAATLAADRPRRAAPHG